MPVATRILATEGRLKTVDSYRLVRVDRRVLVGITIGVLGLVVGAAAVIWDPVAFVVILGFVVLSSIVGVNRLLGHLGKARVQIEELSGKVTELETTVEKESKAREDVEAQLASRIQLTATRTSTHGDSLTDDSTGLYNEGYFTVALEARLAIARRNLKPVAVVLLEVIEGLSSGRARPADPARVAVSIAATIREADTACRMLDGGYALVLEDTAENGAIWTVERIRRHLAAGAPGLTLWAGVACYPAHGFDTDEVLDRADLALDAAREWRQDRIEVASSE
jgi:GGDEF domain-containing protein